MKPLRTPRLIFTFALLLALPLAVFAQSRKQAQSLYAQALREAATGDPYKAIETLTHANQSDPTYQAPLFYRAELKSALGDYYGAIDDYTVLLRMEVGEVDALVGRARNRMLLRQFRMAKLDLHHAITHSPTDPQANGLMHEVELTLNAYESAFNEYSQMVRSEPENPQGYYLRGKVEVMYGDRETGCSDLSRASQMGDRGAYQLINEFCRGNR